MLSTGCAIGLHRDTSPVPPSPSVVCPVIVPYSKMFQDQWADEVEKSPKGSAYRTVTNDYIQERDRIRACQKSNH